MPRTNILNPDIEHYLDSLLPPRREPFATMEAIAAEKHFPIIGPQCGRILMQMALVSGARRVLELGSGYGYSACWFASGMAEGGEIICTDGDAANREAALGFFPKLKKNIRFDFRVGDALEIIRHLDGPFDIVFNDIDKEGYPDALGLVIPRLRPGGLFITDNLLWSGRVLEEPGDDTTEAIKRFNRLIFGHAELISSIIPLRDGLGVAVRRSGV